MKNVTQNFINDIKTYGRQFDFNVAINNESISNDNINYIKPAFYTSNENNKTALFTTIMQQLKIDTKNELAINSKIEIEAGIKVNESNYQYISYNPYTVSSCEKQEDTNSYVSLAYDKMIESMIDYDLELSEKITVRNYLILICNRLGWNTEHIPSTFINHNKLIDPVLHQGINYTFRMALDEIATITCSFLLFKGEDFYLIYPTETNQIIDSSFLDEDNVNMGERYFINSLVFSRAEGSDNIYRKDNESIENNGLHEFKISNNQLLSTNDRDIYIDQMFNYLKTFEFYTFDVQSKGILFLEACDRFTFNLSGNTYSTILLNNEQEFEDGLIEKLYVDRPEETETEYKYADETDKRINQTYLIVDKQNQKIESLVQETSENTQNISLHEQTINGITNTVSSVETKVNNIQVGGRNYLKNSKTIVTIAKPSNNYNQYSWDSYHPLAGKTLSNELTFTLSFRFIPEDEGYKPCTSIVVGKSQNGDIWSKRLYPNNFNVKKYSDYYFYYASFKIPATEGAYIQSFVKFILSSSDSNNIGGQISHLKLEDGNIPTDWTPAPEDIDSNLENNYYTKTQTESKIDQKADEITSTVTSIETKVNNLQIGGTNILRGTDVVTALTSSGTWANGTWRSATSGNGTRERIDIIDSPNANIKKGWRFTRTAENNSSSVDVAQDSVPVANGQTYTMSCWVRNVSGNTRLRLQYGKNPYRNNQPLVTNTSWKKYTYTFTVGEQSDGSTNGSTNIYFGLFQDSVGVLEICGLKLESGNKATDWSPAPEDIASNYYTKTETESKIEQKADSITSTVSQNYSTKAETTQAKNEAINSANTSTDNKLANYSTTTQMNSAITQKANEITSTVTTLENKVNNMQIGGTNLLRGTNTVTALTSPGTWARGTWRQAGTGTGTRTSISVSDAPNANIKVGWSTASTSGQVLICQDNVPTTAGEVYTISCYAKGTGKIKLQYGNNSVGYLGVDRTIEDANTWKKYTYTITSRGTANVYFGSETQGYDVSFCGMKLEKGNMATDWSPAPEDIESNLITNYYTKTETETKIDQKADNITSTVNRTISNIQTGTENLLLNTAIKENTNNWTLASGITRTTSKTTPNGNYCFYYNISGLTSNSWRCANPADVSVQPGEILTADVNVFIPSSNDIDGEVALEIQYFNSSRTRIGYLKKLIDTTVVDKWQKATVTLEAPTNAAYANARVWVLKNGKFYVGDLILSRGNTSASWAPSSNDYTAKTELGTLIEQNWEHIKVAWNQISQYLQLEGTNGSASLNIYNQSNNKLMTLNANGETYYNGSGNEIGKIGIIRQNNKDILAFSMPVDWNNISSSRSMAWGIFDPNNNFLPIFYLAGLYGANNSEYEGQLVVAGGLSAQDIELEQGIIKASIGGFQVLNSNDEVMLSIWKNGSSGSSTYFNLLDLITTYYHDTEERHYLDFHNNAFTNLGNVPITQFVYVDSVNDRYSIDEIEGNPNSYIYARFKEGGDVLIYANSSDRNLKKNIKETQINALEKIKKIKHREFDWKSTEKHQTIGYVAQEMQKVDESFVHHSKYKDKEDWQINTLSVLATATKAIQEQQEIIEDLKSRIEKLEKISK